MLQEIKYYSRMAWGIREFLQTPPIADPQAYTRQNLASRASSFLGLAERGIFNNPGNPHHQMFRIAGCTLGDLTGEVTRHGLEPTLMRLREAGVYVTHEEFKGKEPIVRAGREIPSNSASFLNPEIAGALTQSVSSGSRSKGTPSPRSIGRLLQREVYARLRAREFDLSRRLRIELKPILPSGSGLSSSYRGHREEHPVDHWFAVGGSIREAGHYRLATRCLVLWSRLLGAKAKLPTYLKPNDFGIVAEYIARRRSEGVSVAIQGFTSPAVRVAAAALDLGLDISGALFLVGGEALTDAKREVIERTGSEVYSSYTISEIGPIGHACRQMKSGNCVHLFDDTVAAFVRRRCANFSDDEVNSLQLTTLPAFSSYVLVNAEMDDAGVIGTATCDCLYTRLGFSRQASQIFSYGKLTGQGMTLVGTDLVTILEERLPAQLGGAPGDYQLIEHEGAAQTQMTLRVNPRVPAASDGIKQCFLRELHSVYGGALASRMWVHAEGVEVIRGMPYATRTGKIHVLHVLGSGTKGETRH